MSGPKTVRSQHSAVQRCGSSVLHLLSSESFSKNIVIWRGQSWCAFLSLCKGILICWEQIWREFESIQSIIFVRRRYDLLLRVFRVLCLFGADMMCFWGKRQDWKCLLLGNPPTGHGHKRALLIPPRLVHYRLQVGQNLVWGASLLTCHHWNTKNEEGGVGVIGGHSYATAQSRCRRLGKGLRRLRPFHISLQSSHPDATPLTPFFG